VIRERGSKNFRTVHIDMCGRLVLWGYRRIGGILPMKKLGGLIKNNEDWLLRRIIEFARDRGYIEKFWVLREAWRIIVRELSESLVIFLVFNICICLITSPDMHKITVKFQCFFN
jgi:hypothetical protein